MYLKNRNHYVTQINEACKRSYYELYKRNEKTIEDRHELCNIRLTQILTYKIIKDCNAFQKKEITEADVYNRNIENFKLLLAIHQDPERGFDIYFYSTEKKYIESFNNKDSLLISLAYLNEIATSKTYSRLYPITKAEKLILDTRDNDNLDLAKLDKITDKMISRAIKVAEYFVSTKEQEKI